MSPTSSPPGKRTPKDAKGRGTGGIRGRGGQRGHLAGNPFLKTAGMVPPPRRQAQSSQNPFLAQIAKQEIPVLSSSLAYQTDPPPSYAAVVSGHKQGQQEAKFPVPSFITHGPDSIPVLISDPPGDGDVGANPFLGHQLVDPPPPPLPPPPPQYHTPFTSVSGSQDPFPSSNDPTSSTGSNNPFFTNLLATHDSSSHLLPSFQNSDAGPIESGPQGGANTTPGPVLQAPLHTGGLFATGMEAHSGGNLSDIFQDSNFISEPYVGEAPSANKTLHVKGIPEELNNPVTLKKHFSQFGEVAKLKSYPQKRYATVEFVERVRNVFYHRTDFDYVVITLCIQVLYASTCGRVA